MRETIQKLSNKIKEFNTYDRTIFEALQAGDVIKLNGDSEKVFVRNSYYVWQYRIDRVNYAQLQFSGKDLECIKILAGYSMDEVMFQVYIGDKKYLIDSDWYDRINFEAQAFQIDTTSRYDFDLLMVSEILTDLGVQHV